MASVPLHKDGLGEAQVSGPASARIDAISSAGWKPTITPQFVEEWDKLTSTAAEPNPFYESWHLRAALEACDPAGTIEVVQYRQMVSWWGSSRSSAAVVIMDVRSRIYADGCTTMRFAAYHWSSAA